MDYDALSAKASGLVRFFGNEGTVTYRHKTGQSRNPSTGVTSETFTNYAGLRAVLLDFDEEDRDGDRITDRDSLVIIEGVAFENIGVEPNEDGRMIVGTKEYAIQNVNLLRPEVGGRLLTAEFQIRA